VSLLSRLVENLGRDQAQLEADDLAAECARPGCTRVASLVPGRTAKVTGVVHSLAVQPPDVTPRVEAELYDGTDRLRLVWLGRRSIPGIRTGAYLTVRGRVTIDDDRLTMFNPAYDLLPSRG
jgi:hypothetical protein